MLNNIPLDFFKLKKKLERGDVIKYRKKSRRGFVSKEPSRVSMGKHSLAYDTKVVLGTYSSVSPYKNSKFYNRTKLPY